nr:immunoglobulin light chain junction region [Macaca mulatta]MOW04522.1 immunoglobulin light chain junction region [Macaca mulatta]MOW05473.1 immunoglobulin light chain junction region [Macaca mulatta]MOW06612.1 immunoglobulin light chain junction region [Macaca mulatta]MOW07556.1 immunoglobulin light chain junction region [Macaca mulatta]
DYYCQVYDNSAVLF